MRKIKLSDVTLKELISDYKKMTNKSVSKKYKISMKAIYRILKENNINLKGYYITHYRVIQYIKRNYINKQILYGSLLGDGCVSIYLRNNGSFAEGHCIAQKDYVLWKNKYLNIGIYENDCHIRSSRSDPWCVKLRKEFYPDGKKVVTEKILNKIDKLALLIWYLDDGSINGDNRIAIATHCFTYDEHLIMKKYFKDRWKFETKIYKIGKYCYFKFPARTTRKLLSILQPIFVKYGLPNCMKYKLWRK